MTEHTITNVEHWTTYGSGDRMFELTFEHKNEEHTMLCGRRTNGELHLSHSELLDGTSKMDELVMEDMAEKFIENCEEFFHE